MDTQTLIQHLGHWSARSGPLHDRLAAALQDAIRNGGLSARTRLPAERVLAKALALSRTTVVSAYGKLRTEGLVESRVGSGTWVCVEPATVARRRARTAAVDRSPLINLLTIDDRRTIDFAMGTPEPLSELPAELYSVAPELQRAFLTDRNYMPMGYPLLREAIAAEYRRQGVPTTANQILVTSGAQQAIALVTALLVQRGDTVVSETPTFFGALDCFRLAGARTIGVPFHEHSLNPSMVLDRVNGLRPRVIYTTPTYHNPTGAVLPEARRFAIARLASTTGTVVVEDGSLADLTIDGAPPRPIAAHAPNGPILTIGSMSKLFWAGLRVGWLRGPVAMIDQLGRIKSAWDLGSSLLSQAIATQLLGALDRAKQIRAHQLKRRRDHLASLLIRHLPDWHFQIPTGGLFLWVRIPHTDARMFVQYAARHHVSIAPGPLFTTDDSHAEFLRIPYLLEPAKLRLGVERLTRAWNAAV